MGLFAFQKSLPHVRQALMTGEMTIEGIRPPPLPVSMQSIVPTTQVSTIFMHAIFYHLKDLFGT